LKRISYEDFDAVESPIDTHYFSVSSAKVLLKKPCLAIQQQTELLEFMQAFEFNVITNQANEPVNNHWLGKKTTAFLTDINIQLAKKVSFLEGATDKSTFVVDNFPGDEQIIQIAKSSFRVSRFLNDPYLPVEPAQCIYADITRNAFRRIGRFFVIHKTQQVISGFVLFAISGLSATIELVATNQNFKGRGIGQSLLKSMEHYLSNKGIEIIQVGTQLANTAALKFYISYGFRIKECNSIYHYWPSKP
jgi:dTDP-4-amino-4,6-dideoxy-D-galactose acyltransferase